jgi:hypothetical protein
MTEPLVAPERRGFRAPGTTFMVAGGLIGAVGAYAFQVYGTRNLDPEAFAPVSVLWTAFFILATILLVPVEQYVTREVASGRKALPADLKPAFVMAAIGAVAGGVFVAVTLEDLFFGDPVYIAQFALLMVGYSLLFVGQGGARRVAPVRRGRMDPDRRDHGPARRRSDPVAAGPRRHLAGLGDGHRRVRRAGDGLVAARPG